MGDHVLVILMIATITMQVLIQLSESQRSPLAKRPLQRAAYFCIGEEKHLSKPEIELAESQRSPLVQISCHICISIIKITSIRFMISHTYVKHTYFMTFYRISIRSYVFIFFS